MTSLVLMWENLQIRLQDYKSEKTTVPGFLVTCGYFTMDSIDLSRWLKEINETRVQIHQ